MPREYQTPQPQPPANTGPTQQSAKKPPGPISRAVGGFFNGLSGRNLTQDQWLERRQQQQPWMETVKQRHDMETPSLRDIRRLETQMRSGKKGPEDILELISRKLKSRMR